MVLAQVCWEMGFEPGLGTMNANEGMRGTMRSLGCLERASVTELPGRGVVSELAYTIVRGAWEEVQIVYDFKERKKI